MSVSFHRSVGQQDADPGLTWRRAGREELLLLVAAGRRVAHHGGLGAAGVGRVGGVGLLGATGVLGLLHLLRALFGAVTVDGAAVGLLVVGGRRSARAGVVGTDVAQAAVHELVVGGVAGVARVDQQQRMGTSRDAQGGQGRQGNAGTGHGSSPWCAPRSA